jgi:AcrR family transcriptional regulator
VSVIATCPAPVAAPRPAARAAAVNPTLIHQSVSQTGYLCSMQLTRERIIATAVELIEREGASAVSMRRIASELGSGVMVLYDHVPSKAALLDGVAEQVLADIDLTAAPGAGWDDQLRAQARAFWRKARAYPRCTMVVISRPVESAATLRPVERALTTLRDAGFGGEDAVRVVRAYVAYVAGSLVREVGVTPGLEPQRPLGQDPSVLAADRPFLDPAEFPQVMSLSAELLNRDFEADFEFGLELLIRAIADLRPARRSLPRRTRHVA